MDVFEAELPDLDSLLDQAEEDIYNEESLSSPRSFKEKEALVDCRDTLTLSEANFDPLLEIRNSSSSLSLSNSEILGSLFGTQFTPEKKYKQVALISENVDNNEDSSQQPLVDLSLDDFYSGPVLEERSLSEESARSFPNDNEDFEHSENDAYVSLDNHENAGVSQSEIPTSANSYAHFVLQKSPTNVNVSDVSTNDSDGFDVRYEEAELSETECEIYLQQIDRELGNISPENTENTQDEGAASAMTSVEVGTSVGKEVGDIGSGTKVCELPTDLKEKLEDEELNVESRKFNEREEFDVACEPSLDELSGGVYEERPIRPLVEYFGGDSPDGSFMSDDSSINGGPSVATNSENSEDPFISALGLTEPKWVHDKHRMMCSFCESKFTLVNRRHHCRACGEVFCGKCSDNRKVLAFNPSLGPQRVCRSCRDFLQIQEEEAKRLSERQRQKTASVAFSDGNHFDSTSDQPKHTVVSHRDPSQYCNRVPPSLDSLMPTDPESRPNNWIVYIPPQLVNPEECVSSPPTTKETLPIKSALKTPRAQLQNLLSGDRDSPEQGLVKQRVCFADGVLPGSAVIEDPPVSKYDVIRKNAARRRMIVHKQENESNDGGSSFKTGGNDDENEEIDVVEVKPGSMVRRKLRESCLGAVYESMLLSNNQLPEIVGDFAEELRKLESENRDVERDVVINQQCRDPGKPPVVFKLETNLFVDVKVCDLSCCSHGDCFVFISRGLEHHCQTEVCLVIKCVSPNEPIPTSIFDLYSHIYRMALLGITFSNMDFLSTTEAVPHLLVTWGISGILFFTLSYQCEKNLPLPPEKETRSPLLFGIMLQRWESVWAQVYPLRVLLRIGHAYKQYPCPIVTVRDREALFVDANGSLLDQFVDVQTFKFNDFTILNDSFANIIAEEQNSAAVLIPRNRYDLVKNTLSQRHEEDEIIFGLSFSTFADSHLVCFEKDDGVFEPQAICRNVDGKRQCTGIGFILFGGNLSPDMDDGDTCAEGEGFSLGVTAKITIVEDGLMVMMCTSVFSRLKQSMLAMKDFQISCQSLADYKAGVEASQSLTVRWIDDYEVHSPCEISPIDGLDLETTVSCNVFNAYDYICRPANYRKAVIATNKLNECKNNSTSGDASEKGPSKEEEDDSKYGAAKCAFSGDSAKLSSGIVRWTRIFYLNEDKPSQPLVDEANDTDRLPQKLARAFAFALSPHLAELRCLQYKKIALRVEISSETTEYKAGSNGCVFKPPCAISDSVDTHLIPLVFEEAARVQSTSPIAIELHFYILDVDSNN